MCGRYIVDDETEKDILRLAEVFEAGTFIQVSGDRFPSQKAWVLTKGSKAESMIWGFRGRTGTLLINARAETAMSKPTFSEHVKNRRCVIPAAGFYEWDSSKNRHTFTCKGTLFLAGFYRTEQDGNHFIILTTAANSSMKPVHDRMPLIFSEDQIEDWLENDLTVSRFLRAESPFLTDVQQFEQISL